MSPTASQFTESNLVTLLLSGLAGHGKSTLAMQAPLPIAALLVDKPIVAAPPKGTPGYDPSLVFWKSYPPPEIDLTNEKAGRPRNIADEIFRDVMVVKNHLIAVRNYEAEQQALGVAKIDDERVQPPVLKMGGEAWPTPRTLIIEGGDFISKHVENWVCSTAGKGDPSEWEDKFEPWRRRLNKLAEIYDLLTYLPSTRLCNLVVTTGLDEESKMVKNERGKSELTKTGKVDPDLGGKMATEGPRKFQNSWLCVADAGKWWVVTKPTGRYVNHRGIRSGGFGLADIVDVTINDKAPVNIWDRLFKRS